MKHNVPPTPPPMGLISLVAMVGSEDDSKDETAAIDALAPRFTCIIHANTHTQRMRTHQWWAR